MTFELFQAGLIQGAILAILGLGVLIPFRFLNFPDLTSEGSYPLGGIASAALIVSGVPSVIACLLGAFMSGVMGIGTAWIHIRFKVNTLLCGIVLSTMIYSVNLRLMGKPNISLFGTSHLFSSFEDDISVKIFILMFLIFIIFLFMFLFFKTQKGLQFRAVGLNPHFAQRQGVNLDFYTILGLFFGNFVCGLAGALMVQTQGYADIGMGIGIVVHGLAALMIGEKIIKVSSVKSQILAPIVGAFIYQQIQGIALTLGLAPSDLKFLTGAIILIVMAVKK